MQRLYKNLMVYLNDRYILNGGQRPQYAFLTSEDVGKQLHSQGRSHLANLFSINMWPRWGHDDRFSLTR